MDIKNISLHRRGRRKGKKGDTARLAAQLAPLEEQDTRLATGLSGGDPASGNGLENRDPGSIIVDNDNLNLPKDIVEGQGVKTFLGMEPVVLVILGVMLVFIAFVAWQISLMPVE